MNDFHWWMGLAPLLGFLLDALLGGTRLDDLFEGQVRRSVPRVRFLMGKAFGGPTRGAGYALMAWTAATAILVAWALSTAGYVLSQEYGVFAVRSTLFLLLFTARRLTARGIEGLVLISSGDLDAARASLRRLGPGPLPDEADSLYGASVERLSGATLTAVLVPLFWGLVGGSTLAAGALAAHLAALMRPDGPDGDSALWHSVDRVDRWICLPAAWVGALVYPWVVSLVGGRRTTALSAFAGNPQRSPARRLGRAIGGGFGLRSMEPEGALVASAQEVQKVVQVLFLGGLLCALLVSAASAGLHHLM